MIDRDENMAQELILSRMFVVVIRKVLLASNIE